MGDHLIKIFSMFTFWAVVSLSVESQAKAQHGSSVVDKPSAPDWIVVLAMPNYGWLKNKTRIEIPKGRDGNNELVYDKVEITDEGFGGGLTMMASYKRFTYTNVLFGFPRVNQASVLGSINYLSYIVPTGIFAEPYMGLGLAMIRTNADYYNFKQTRYDDLGGMRLKGFASMDEIHVRNKVFATYPKLGVKLKIPVQHWSITPFYSFMFEDVSTHTWSTGGIVELYDADGPSSKEVGGEPLETVNIRAFDKKTDKRYISHLVGANFFLDFHYFMQLRGKLYYNTNHDLWTIRLIGSIMLGKNFGISAYFEYTEKITVTNTYLLVGPSFIFTPTGFMEKMMAQRKNKSQTP